MGRNTRQRQAQRVQRSKRYRWSMSPRELFILTSKADPTPKWPDTGKEIMHAR